MPDQCFCGWVCLEWRGGCLLRFNRKRMKPIGAHARLQEKVRGHFTVVRVCGYINVCRDLRWESGLCSSASGGQIGSDRQNQASLL